MGGDEGRLGPTEGSCAAPAGGHASETSVTREELDDDE